jgi:hypothetical protein
MSYSQAEAKSGLDGIERFQIIKAKGCRRIALFSPIRRSHAGFVGSVARFSVAN